MLLRQGHPHRAAPGPYTDDDARAYAAAALIPTEVLERPAPAGDRRLAHGLGVPLAELHAARADHHVGAQTR